MPATINMGKGQIGRWRHETGHIPSRGESRHSLSQSKSRAVRFRTGVKCHQSLARRCHAAQLSGPSFGRCYCFAREGALDYSPCDEKARF